MTTFVGGYNQKRAALVALLLCTRIVVAADRLARIDDALLRAGTFLSAKQDRDGAWRSGVHGSFRDGPSLTPHVLTVLHFLQPGGPEIRASCDAGLRYLRGLTRTPHGDAIEPAALTFPIYTAAAASWVIG